LLIVLRRIKFYFPTNLEDVKRKAKGRKGIELQASALNGTIVFLFFIVSISDFTKDNWKHIKVAKRKRKPERK